MSQKEIARLQSQIDQLESELSHLHELLIRVGFENGITTLKEACNELIEISNPLDSSR